MNVNFHYDALNDFGKLTAAGNFPNVINMGDATAERMAVDIKLPDGAITGSVTLSVQGADAEDGAYTTIVTGGAVAAADLNADGYGLPIPKTKYKFLRAAVSGGFTGTVQALINSYIGK